MSSYIDINVGGTIYTTTIRTLTRDPQCFFSLMMLSGNPLSKDEDGNYLIDRDGEIFRHVLNFLRCDKLVLPEGFDELPLLESEAEFYLLPSLKQAVRKLLGNDSTGDIIGLNVGGKIYKTTRATLTSEPNSFFCDMLESETHTPRDEEGNYVIDRDGEIFRYILDFLRCGNLVLPTANWGQEGALSREATFFKLPVLREQLQVFINFAEFVFFIFFTGNRVVGYTKTGNDHLMDVFSFLPNYTKYVDKTLDDARTIAFELDRSLAGKAMTSSPTPRLKNYDFVYPANADEMLNLITKRCGAPTSRVKVSKYCVKCSYLRISYFGRK